MSLGSTKLAAAERSPAERLDTLPSWPWDILDDEAPRTLGWHAIAWAEGWTGFPGLPDGWKGLTQPNGPRAGKRFRLTERQRRFRLWFYALDDDAQWVYSSGRRRLSKGSGKSPDAGVHALTEFLGPVRLATFRRGAPGGCDGRPVDMPLVQIAATAESQTANTMRMVRAFAPKRSHVVEVYQLDPGKTQYYKIPEGTLEAITSSVTASEGAESSFIVEDELEHWKPSNAGPELAATLDDNLAKSGARSVGTMNAWVPGVESVAEADWDAWVAEQEGSVKADAGRILYDAVIAPPDTDMGDYESLKSALEWIYLDCDWKHPGGVRTATSKPDVRPIIKRIWSPRSEPSESKRKYLNWPTSATDAWCTAEDWSACSSPEIKVEDGDEIVVFFDGSKSQDSTALVGCRVSDGHVFLISGWERPLGPQGEGWQVPIDEVDAAVEWMFDRWSVLAFFGDVREWESWVQTTWPERHGEGLVLWAQKQGRNASPIAWDMRGHTMEFTRAAEACLSDIQERLLTHSGDPAMHRHVVNCRRRPNRWGVSVGKESRDSPKKIDIAVCAIGARMVRRMLLASDEWKQRQAGSSKTGGRVVGWS